MLQMSVNDPRLPSSRVAVCNLQATGDNKRLCEHQTGPVLLLAPT